ncbi:MAG TPA: sodium:proline symporter, partial [Vicinamibacteria bacterium]|nr:sodium:proline symporter [Vicinamibacteria bacterium]
GVGFPMLIRDVAPAGLRGLMLVAFFAAFMSTISTQVNWAASYLVGDFYRRFVRPQADETHLTRASRVATIFVLVIGAGSSWLMRGLAVDEAWKLLAALGAGTGAVFMLRWFWWRINAWSEISAMAASLVYFVIVSRFVQANEHRLAIVAALTIVTWVAATFLTRPENDVTLERFYERIRPGGRGWGPIARRQPELVVDRNLGTSVLTALLATAVIYLTLPGIGFLLFGETTRAILCLGSAAALGFAVYRLTKKLGFERLYS